MRVVDRRSLDDERGITLLLVALLMVAMLVIAGLVLDVGLARTNRQVDKSAADFAVNAGMGGLDQGDGIPHPWAGVCHAWTYLKANNTKFSSGSTTVVLQDQASNPIAGNDPCTASLQSQTCTANQPLTWAWLRATTTDGIVVDIKSGYDLDDGAFADENYSSFASDDGDSTLGNCDHLAVIVSETEDTGFGAAAGVSELSTRIRSVGRVTIENDEDAVVALLLLERNDCDVLSISGGATAKVIVGGNGPRQGIMHADSLGNGSGCNSNQIYNVPASSITSPVIIAETAETGTPPAQGLIRARSLSDAAGAQPNKTNSPCPARVEAKNGGCPTAGDLLGRSRVDERYRSHVIALRHEAATRVAWSNGQATANGFTVAANGCNPTTTETAATNLFLRCNNFSPNTPVVITSTNIVITGRVDLSGSGQLIASNPRTLYIGGSTNQTAISVNTTLSVNASTATDTNLDGSVCDERRTAGPTQTTEMVIVNGPMSVQGNAATLFRMCSTVLVMGDNNGVSTSCPIPSFPAAWPANNPCAIPDSDGVEPYDNDFRGRLSTSGQGSFDWSAPNRSLTTSTATEWAEFEDLGFWTEAQDTSGIQGEGSVVLRGVFFTPNTDPFDLGGGGAFDIEEAQFVTRRLSARGNAQLRMRPDPNNSVTFPVFKSATLIR